MSAAEALSLVHHHPGRLRVRCRSFASDPSLRARVTGALRSVTGVDGVESNATTGSVLVTYDPRRIDAGTLLERIAGPAGLDVQYPLPAPRVDARDIFAAARALDTRVLAWTGGRMSLRTGVPAALCFGSAISFAWSGHLRAPRWDNLLYWGITFLWRLNPPSRSTRAAAEVG